MRSTIRIVSAMLVTTLASAAWGDYYWTGASTTNPTDWYDTANWTSSGGNCVFGGSKKDNIVTRTVAFTNAVSAAVSSGLWVENGSTNRDEAVVWTTGADADANAGLTVKGSLNVGTGTWGALKAEKGRYSFSGSGIIGNSSGCSYLKATDSHFSFGGDFDLAIKSAKTVFEMTGGTVDVAGNGWWACDGSARTVADISGGTLTFTNSLYLGNNNGSGSSDVTIRDAGRLDILSSGDGLSYYAGSNVVNVVDGGTLGAHWIRFWGKTGTVAAELNINGGRLIALGNNVSGFAGKFMDGNDNFNVTVGEKGGILDANGHDTWIDSAIGGTGTLVITNSSDTSCYVEFKKALACLVKIAMTNGTVRLPVGTSIASAPIVVGKGFFLEYDLSSITESGLTTNLMENVTFSIAEGDNVGRHVIIRNSASVYWDVTYSDGALTATSKATNAAVGDFTIFTGYYNSDCPNDQVKSFVNGKPTVATDLIVPASIPVMGQYCSMVCSNLVIHGDLTIEGRVGNTSTLWKNFRPQGIVGTGTLTFTTPKDGYGYLESYNAPAGTGLVVDVPVILDGSARVTSRSDRKLKFNKPVTISGTNVTVCVGNGNTAPVFADNLTITGTYDSSSYTTEIAADKTLAGDGTLKGSLTFLTDAVLATDGLTVSGTLTLNDNVVDLDVVSNGYVVARANKISGTATLSTALANDWQLCVGDTTMTIVAYGKGTVVVPVDSATEVTNAVKSILSSDRNPTGIYTYTSSEGAVTTNTCVAVTNATTEVMIGVMHDCTVSSFLDTSKLTVADTTILKVYRGNGKYMAWKLTSTGWEAMASVEGDNTVVQATAAAETNLAAGDAAILTKAKGDKAVQLFAGVIDGSQGVTAAKGATLKCLPSLTAKPISNLAITGASTDVEVYTDNGATQFLYDGSWCQVQKDANGNITGYVDDPTQTIGVGEGIFIRNNSSADSITIK